MKQKQDSNFQTDYIRTSKAPKEYDIGRSKLQHWISSGFLPVFTPEGHGSRIRFIRRSDLEKYIRTGQPVTQ